MGVSSQQCMLSSQENCTLVDLLGTTFSDEPERTDQKSRVLLKILKQGFMNLISQASPPILGRPQSSILNEMMHHCVRFHQGFLTGVGHPVLPGSTVRHICTRVFSEKGSFCGPCAGWNQLVLCHFLFSLLSSLLQSKNPAIAAPLPCYHQHFFFFFFFFF
jgi:hypothetical protein